MSPRRASLRSEDSSRSALAAIRMICFVPQPLDLDDTRGSVVSVPLTRQAVNPSIFYLPFGILSLLPRRILPHPFPIEQIWIIPMSTSAGTQVSTSEKVRGRITYSRVPDTTPPTPQYRIYWPTAHASTQVQLHRKRIMG